MALSEPSLKTCHGWPPHLRAMLKSEVAEGDVSVNSRFIILKWHALVKHSPPSKVQPLDFPEDVPLGSVFTLGKASLQLFPPVATFSWAGPACGCCQVPGKPPGLATGSVCPATLSQPRNHSVLIQGRWLKGCDISHHSFLWSLHKLPLRFRYRFTPV